MLCGWIKKIEKKIAKAKHIGIFDSKISQIFKFNTKYELLYLRAPRGNPNQGQIIIPKNSVKLCTNLRFCHQAPIS